MLSRTASDLYWMSRYLERAENLARMLDAPPRARVCRDDVDRATTCLLCFLFIFVKFGREVRVRVDTERRRGVRACTASRHVRARRGVSCRVVSCIGKVYR